jgi:ubiquinone/menaquinone biosynthesis C-methylase UbiE
LSTRAWADRADEVVGVEPNAAMLSRAEVTTDAANVRFVNAFAADTGLPANRADVVTCSQSFHWMEPGPVLAEAARLLRAGGVFAAYDYDVPPVVQPEVDEAFRQLFAARRAARARLEQEAGAVAWPKEGHLERIRESERFRFTRELACHSFDRADAHRLVGLAATLGGPHGDSAPEVDDAIGRLREIATDVLGDRTWPMVICYRARVGVK